jgi:hypothetical protein
VTLEQGVRRLPIRTPSGAFEVRTRKVDDHDRYVAGLLGWLRDLE